MYYDRLFILSAKYGLIEPEDYIEPYNETLNEKTVKERREWSNMVFNQIKDKLPNPSLYELYFHAGARYREFLILLLIKAGYLCKVSLKGMKIGEQLARYKKQMLKSGL